MAINGKIVAIGSYVPEEVLDNAYFEKIIDTNDEWITSRTGIKERRRAREDEFVSDLIIGAGKNLLERFPDQTLADVDFILVATSTSDFVFPNTASIVQNALGIQNSCGALDIASACSGFTYGLFLAETMVKAGQCKKVLVAGAETLTKITDYTDRSSCMLFGDGAGVALVEATEGAPENKFIFGTDGDKGQFLYCTNQSNKINDVVVEKDRMLHQNGREVFKWAVTTVSDHMKKLIEDAGLTPDDIDRYIPHSANMRILKSIASNLGVSLDKFSESIVYNGNTSSATIPLSITGALDKGDLKKGDKVLLYGFGGGLTHSGVILTWDA